MQIDKQQVLDLMKSRGNDAQGAQGGQRAPAKVDPGKDSAMLGKFGITPEELLDKL